MINTVRRE